jgi:hypothetical protein
MDTRALYERLDSETDKAWAAFQTYRDMSPYRRGIEALYEEYKATQLVEWRREYQWEARATEWDRVRDKATRRAELEIISAIRKQSFEVARDLIAYTSVQVECKMDECFDADEGKFKSNANLRDLTNCLSETNKLINLLIGQPTEIIKTNKDKQDLTGMSAEELMKLRELQQKVKELNE